LTLSLRLGLIAGLSAGLLLLSQGEPEARPPPPRPLPIFPQPVAFELSPSLVRSAAAYEDYMARASLMNPAFTSGDDVEAGLRLGASEDPRALLRGEIAYAAIAALADPTYVVSVRSWAASDEGRRQMSALIEADPRNVINIRGSASAAGLVIKALMDQGRAMSKSGAAVTQAAYDVQRQSWSSQVVPDRVGRLALAKATNNLGQNAPPDVVAHLQRASQGYDPLPLNAPSAASPYPPVVIRGLAVAALIVLGEAGPENEEAMEPLLSEPAAATCENLARLDLYQCLAVSKPYYEDVFCLGAHALADTGQCVMIDAGAPVPPATETAATIDASDAAAAAAHYKGKGKGKGAAK
jgi:hypothetical protein